MKRPFASLLLVAVVLLCSSHFLLANNPGKDFLITLDGAKLTGSIRGIDVSSGHSEISFENDFGDIYTVHPATIFGFVCEAQGETMLYESKCLKGEWLFLRVEKKGEVLSLYTSFERQLQFTQADEPPIVVEEKNPQVWLQFKGEQPFKLHRLTYRRVLRKRMASYPDLANRIGKRGFRYDNIAMITDLYNKFHHTD
ncbi:MAG: hypothetical protein AAF990_10165 [Bacteroidota bacterium]